MGRRSHNIVNFCIENLRAELSHGLKLRAPASAKEKGRADHQGTVST